MLARLWARLRASERLFLGVVLLAAGLPVALGGLAVVVHQLGEDRRFAAEGVAVQGRVLGKEIRKRVALLAGDAAEGVLLAAAPRNPRAGRGGHEPVDILTRARGRLAP